MGAAVDIPTANYGFKSWRCHWPKDAFARKMMATLGEANWRRYRVAGAIQNSIVCAVSLFGIVVAGSTLIKAARVALGTYVLVAGWAAFAVLLASLPRLLSLLKSPSTRELENRTKQEQPQFVMQLTRLPS
jgi:hypothetical protein